MLCNIPRGLLQMSEGKIKQDSSMKCRSSLLSPVQECERGWKLQWQWQAGCACSFFPKKAAVHPCFPTWFFSQTWLSFLPLPSPLFACSNVQEALELFWNVLAGWACWWGQIPGYFMWDVSQALGFSWPTLTDQDGMGLLPLPKLSLSCWIKAAEPGLSLP